MGNNYVCMLMSKNARVEYHLYSIASDTVTVLLCILITLAYILMHS